VVVFVCVGGCVCGGGGGGVWGGVGGVFLVFSPPPPDFVPFEPLDVHRTRNESYATGGHPSAVNVNFLQYIKISMQTQELLRRHELKRLYLGGMT